MNYLACWNWILFLFGLARSLNGTPYLKMNPPFNARRNGEERSDESGPRSVRIAAACMIEIPLFRY